MILLDSLGRPLKALRVSVTDRCNFRCPYCMPKNSSNDSMFLDSKQILSFKEIICLVKVFVKLGVRKVRLTGGEPLLREDLPNLISQLRRITNLKDIALTTNASLLQNMILPLKQAGLNRITVSLPTLDPTRFCLNSNSKISINQIIHTLESVKAAGFQNTKLNCVLRKGVNELDIIPLAKFARDNGYIIRFIEFMDVGNQNNWCLDSVIPAKEVASIISNKWPIERIKTSPNNCVAQHWKYLDGKGELGLIASVTEPFCNTCDRARLSADGQLYTCLFASKSLSLKSYMQKGMSSQDLAMILENRWKQRDDRYSELRNEQVKNLPRTEMFRLGG